MKGQGMIMKKQLVLALSTSLVGASIQRPAQALPAVQPAVIEVNANGVVAQTIQQAIGADGWKKLLAAVDNAMPALLRIRETGVKEKEKSQLRKKLDEIMTSAALTLGNSRLLELKNQSDELNAKIAESRRVITKLEEEKVGAPETVSRFSFTKSKASIQAEIDSLKEGIKAYGNQIKDVKRGVSSYLKAQGYDMSSNQIDALLYSITAEDDIHMLSVYHNIKIITQETMGYMKASNENPELAKKYYAMHALLLRTLIALHADYLEKLQSVYRPKLQTILDENNSLINKTKDTAEDPTVSERRRASAQNNLRAQQLTAETAILYAKYLQSTYVRVFKALEALNDDYMAAEETLATVTQASQLIDLMKMGSAEEILKLQVPDLALFQNTEMSAKFLNLTERMRQLN